MAKTTTIGLYLVAQWAIPKVQALAKRTETVKPSLLVTTGPLHKQPIPDLFSLSLAKTAQRNLIQSLHTVYNHQGIHIALLMVGGPVSPEMMQLNPSNIAAKMFEIYNQHRSQWTVETEIFEP